MKQLLQISAFIVLNIFLTLPLVAQVEDQETPPSAAVIRRESTKKEVVEDGPKLSTRAATFNELLTQNADDAPWKRVIYRRVNLMEEVNAPLYYPEQSREGMNSLFSTIFDLMNRGRVKVYEYLDGYDVFDEEHELDFKDFLDRYHIMYSEAPKDSGLSYKVDPSDVPNRQVKAYYIKEASYLDPTNSSYEVKILALCPILSEEVGYSSASSEGDYDMLSEEESLSVQNMPLFWIPYEEIRPYIAQQKVMLSSVNNTRKATLDDFFRLGQYKGDIVMTNNLQDQAIAQKYASKEYSEAMSSMKAEQNRVEKELEDFKQSLYVASGASDSTVITESSSKSNAGTSTRSVRSGKTSRDKEAKTRDPKPAKVKKAKASKPAKSSGTRSVRTVRGRG